MSKQSKAEPRIQIGPDFEDSWPGASALSTECVLNLSVLASMIEAYAQALVREQGISSLPAFNVLTILHGAGEPLPPSLIAERMILTRGTMTSILDSLEKRGFVRRTPHEKDGRMLLIQLTPEGSAAVETLLPRLHQTEKRWMDCLTTAQQRTLLDLVALIQANAPGHDVNE